MTISSSMNTAIPVRLNGSSPVIQSRTVLTTEWDENGERVAEAGLTAAPASFHIPDP